MKRYIKKEERRSGSRPLGVVCANNMKNEGATLSLLSILFIDRLALISSSFWALILASVDIAFWAGSIGE